MKCSAIILIKGMNFHRTRKCRREATMTENGKPFCSVHEPKTVEKRRFKSAVVRERKIRAKTKLDIYLKYTKPPS